MRIIICNQRVYLLLDVASVELVYIVYFELCQLVLTYYSNIYNTMK